MDRIEADYIIVGGGSAGAVLAYRLSADPAIRVILLEAGTQAKGVKTIVPAAGSLYLRGSSADWQYMGEPDPTLDGRRICWSGGKLLGGSSTINGMVYFRGSRADYDHWSIRGAWVGHSRKSSLIFKNQNGLVGRLHRRTHGLVRLASRRRERCRRCRSAGVKAATNEELRR
ncbi:hypothetical protein SCLO_1025560 [Sphingobium cloacae]|uniref:Glucose-methanol-choline oxidoreductase N-terminal domain-containing protein n=1 Tax=Sphingobium cloacae TaxID=120107 RepID=A0A1E1F506_9SPHN|nr:hypothetical protein SCLO_1025560 [Sphingobium cloacae]